MVRAEAQGARQRFRVDRLKVEGYADRETLGTAAARRVASLMRGAIAREGRVNVMFAAAPSQREFLSALAGMKNLDWSRVVAMQMDEYAGLAGSARTLAGFLKEHLYDLVRPGRVYNFFGAATDADRECDRYARVLAKHPVDIVCAGIGENGHLAFNDPPADFEDPDLARVVALDERSRAQQLHDAQFASLDDVPRTAFTVTIPVLMRAKSISCVVPGSAKAEAVRAALQDAVSPMCPASVLRGHPRSVLYLDEASAALLKREC